MAFLHFQELDDHINNVATKVVHLGDQLEGVNTPRARAEEAKKLIEYFSEFLDDYGPKAEVFNDPFQVRFLFYIFNFNFFIFHSSIYTRLQIAISRD